jgi:hypothetical protein
MISNINISHSLYEKKFAYYSPSRSIIMKDSVNGTTKMGRVQATMVSTRTYMSVLVHLEYKCHANGLQIMINQISFMDSKPTYHQISPLTFGLMRSKIEYSNMRRAKTIFLECNVQIVFGLMRSKTDEKCKATILPNTVYNL